MGKLKMWAVVDRYVPILGKLFMADSAFSLPMGEVTNPRLLEIQKMFDLAAIIGLERQTQCKGGDNVILTKEDSEDFSDEIYTLEIESYPSGADPSDSKYQRVEMSEEAILGLKKLQGAAELEETVSISLRFRPITADLLLAPVELSADQLKNLISAINLLTSGLLDDRFKGIAYPIDGGAPYLVVK